MNFCKRVFLFLILSINTLIGNAQSDSSALMPRLRVSLLTCGPGAEIYSVFGHTAVRIVDSVAQTDIVYNYGTFDGYDEQFEINFMRGKLLYYLSVDSYPDFIGAYADEARWVDEQVLQISPTERREIQDYLKNNLKPENRAYKYDFFFDNCATRVRDIFTGAHGSLFKYPEVVPAGGLTFRQIINRYLAGVPWERFGINILLGSKIDRRMSNADIMFLPDYLEDAVGGATLNGNAYTNGTKRIVEGALPEAQPSAIPWILWPSLFVLTLSLFIPNLRLAGRVLSSLVLAVSALLGVLILFMWFGTDHQACANNFNVLWALPTNLLYLFRRRQTKYALIALFCIMVSILLHIFNVQGLLLPDMLPFILMLVVIFATDYRKYQIR